MWLSRVLVSEWWPGTLLAKAQVVSIRGDQYVGSMWPATPRPLSLFLALPLFLSLVILTHLGDLAGHSTGEITLPSLALHTHTYLSYTTSQNTTQQQNSTHPMLHQKWWYPSSKQSNVMIICELTTDRPKANLLLVTSTQSLFSQTNSDIQCRDLVSMQW